MGLQVFSGSFFLTHVAELTLSSFGLVVFVGLLEVVQANVHV